MTMKLFVQKIALLIMLATLLYGAASCSKNSSTGKPNKIDSWPCTMHPSVREKGPGKCPICSMDLVPVMKESTTPTGSSKSVPHHDHAAMLAGKPSDRSATSSPSHEFVVPVERQQQIGVRYAKVERKPLRHTIRAVGLIVPDKTRNWQFVSRVEGYVQKLVVTAPGELVEKDAPLLSIYSPDLLTSEREFVELLRMRDQAKSKDARETPQRLIESAKRRLQLGTSRSNRLPISKKRAKPPTRSRCFHHSAASSSQCPLTSGCGQNFTRTSCRCFKRGKSSPSAQNRILVRTSTARSA